MTLWRRIESVTLAVGLLGTGSLAWATDVTGTLAFVGINPCRIIDTRHFTGQAGPPALVAGATRNFQITGTVPGIPTQCGIPTAATAISVTITAAGFTGAGDLRVFPYGGSVPTASVLNYALENIANTTTVPLGLIGPEKGITVQADVSSTQLIADVNGYYISGWAPGLLPQVCGANEVSIGGHCYYLDGSRGVCDPGYQVASQSVLATIAPMFGGLNYKHTISANCCIFNADPDEDYGMAVHCNTAGPFTAGDVTPGAVGCTNQTNFGTAQLTLCGK